MIVRHPSTGWEVQNWTINRFEVVPPRKLVKKKKHKPKELARLSIVGAWYGFAITLNGKIIEEYETGSFTTSEQLLLQV